MDGTNRLLIGIPIAAAVVGLALLVWHNSREPEEAPPRDQGQAVVNVTPLPPSPAPSDDSVSPGMPGSTGGSLRLFVHFDDKGVKDADLTVYLQQDRSKARRFKSNAAGICLMQGMPPGRYVVVVRAPGFASVGTATDVHGGLQTSLRLELTRGGSIHGGVQSTDGSPLANVEVKLLHNKKRSVVHPSLTTITDGQGRYRIEGIPPQEFAVHFRHARHRPQFIPDQAIRTADDQLEVNGILEPGTSLTGRVMDAAGAPLTKVTMMGVNEEMSTGKTNEKGEFELFGLGDTPVTVSAQKPGYGTIWVRGVAPNRQGLQIRLEKAGQISVQIIGESRPGLLALVLTRYVEEYKREISVQTPTREQDDGSILILNVAPGTYWVDVKCPGHKAVNRPQVIVRPEQTVENVIIRLIKSAE